MRQPLVCSQMDLRNLMKLTKPWYINVDMSKYIALLVDTLNHDSSISNLLSPVERIQQRVKEYNETHYGK